MPATANITDRKDCLATPEREPNNSLLGEKNLPTVLNQRYRAAKRKAYKNSKRSSLAILIAIKARHFLIHYNRGFPTLAKDTAMSKSIIHTNHAPAAIGSYSQAVRAGDTVYLS